ncbi:hypothetical protein HY441_02200 [Candidatus Microgenomates bacterium]|nr:hypothetical protein [Candidatus Microgenomates bacterium]
MTVTSTQVELGDRDYPAAAEAASSLPDGLLLFDLKPYTVHSLSNHGSSSNGQETEELEGINVPFGGFGTADYVAYQEWLQQEKADRVAKSAGKLSVSIQSNGNGSSLADRGENSLSEAVIEQIKVDMQQRGRFLVRRDVILAGYFDQDSFDRLFPESEAVSA